MNAGNKRKLKTSHAEILKRISLLNEHQIANQRKGHVENLQALNMHRGAFCIFGGAKNQARDKSLLHFVRDDGAWFDFSITVREMGGKLELLAYDFELRLEPGMGSPFFRFDLNLPDHRNQARDLRSHLHPGCDDLLVPAPMMTPAEVLRLLIEGARRSSDREPRGLTAFEVSWLEQTWRQAVPRPL